jgi:hypothetical protein
VSAKCSFTAPIERVPIGYNLNHPLIGGGPWSARKKREGCVMEKSKELLAFPGVVLLIVGAVALQMARADAVTLPSDAPTVVKTIAVSGANARVADAGFRPGALTAR